MEEVLKRYPVWDIDTDNAVFEVSPPLRSWEKLPVVIPSASSTSVSAAEGNAAHGALARRMFGAR